MIDTVEKTTIRKIYVRLLPLLFVAYFICYLDRINVGFAALTMNTDLGFTATVYALGATAPVNADDIRSRRVRLSMTHGGMIRAGLASCGWSFRVALRSQPIYPPASL